MSLSPARCFAHRVSTRATFLLKTLSRPVRSRMKCSPGVRFHSILAPLTHPVFIVSMLNLCPCPVAVVPCSRRPATLSVAAEGLTGSISAITNGKAGPPSSTLALHLGTFPLPLPRAVLLSSPPPPTDISWAISLLSALSAGTFPGGAAADSDAPRLLLIRVRHCCPRSF
ncbi:hypothetical protein MIND_00558200 [Mycena indigotica]|uniref:Uncharacterized protein n=1 Tax=Mycena indigotica TaxID=2126181 RepID=A0A8H6T194_9AGAR|nr:uncharacterized protein MIND_00558200 [Mycena indigotica]KAF7307630.1 hypothetical protein MIND_00558200 [Mycena indigotica]